MHRLISIESNCRILVLKESNNQDELYRERDRLNQEALASGKNLTQLRYAVRTV